MKFYTFEIPLKEAMEIPGLRAMFGESYPDPVRVVTIGISYDEIKRNSKAGYEYSIELCGGTHVLYVKHIDKFAILSEGSISKGIRRIVAVTGQEALKVQK